MKFAVLIAILYFSYRILFSPKSNSISGKEKEKEIEYIDYEEINEDE